MILFFYSLILLSPISRYMIYGKSNTLDVDRVIDMLQVRQTE
jgi:hypothetical protein